MAWLELLLAGGLEVFWSTFMKLSEGFTRPLYTVLTLIGLVLSFLFLSQATRVLPLGNRLRHLDRHWCRRRCGCGHRHLSGAGYGPADGVRGPCC